METGYGGDLVLALEELLVPPSRQGEELGSSKVLNHMGIIRAGFLEEIGLEGLGGLKGNLVLQREGRRAV